MLFGRAPAPPRPSASPSPRRTRNPAGSTPSRRDSCASRWTSSRRVGGELVDGDRLQRDLLALGVDLEAHHAALPLLLQATFDEAQLGGERLDGDPLGRLA